MLNFIICDDVKQYRDMIENIISSYMMKNKLEYKTHIYSDYNDDFIKIIESKLPFKIYILDIETPTRSGIDIARVIRKKDPDSILIFLTGHQELSQIVIKNDFLFLSFINKFDDCERRLRKSLDHALKLFKIKKIVRFKENGILYTIPLDNILYITRDSVDRKCIIVTAYNTFKTGKSLFEIEDMLDNNFVKTHRACYINKTRIISYDKNQRIVEFDNGDSTDLISTRFDKELI